ncbi:uncharacterized protein BDV17DRAFT_287865 [Aspergillus undulatus]|uniref:uncharacterized protein n=1 Tax=Aspergillus undulatus TaxID=1810928 RepID=UPI003CCD6F7C
MSALLSYFDPPSLWDPDLLASAREAERIQARAKLDRHDDLTRSYSMVALALRHGNAQALSAWIDHAASSSAGHGELAVRNIARAAVRVDSVSTLKWLMGRYSMKLNLDSYREADDGQLKPDNSQLKADDGQLPVHRMFREALRAYAFDVAK